MTVKLLTTWGDRPAGTLFTADSATEAAMVSGKVATATLTGGVVWQPPGGQTSGPGSLSTSQLAALVSNNAARLGAVAAGANSIDPTRAFKVMASPPTVVYAATALAAITPKIRYAVGYQDSTLPLSLGSSAYSHFTLHNAGKLAAGSNTTPRFEFLRPLWRSRNTAPPVCDNCTHSYLTESRYFEIEVINYSGGFSLYVKVNDAYISLTPQGYSAPVGVDAKAFYSLDFGAGSAGVEKRIDVVSINCFIGAVSVQSPYAVRPAPTRGPRAFLVADSWGQDYNADGTGAFSLSRVMQEHLGWDDFWNNGSGATGYLANFTGAEFTYRQRLVSDVLPYSPELVFFLGSLNDDSQSYASIYAEALLTYRTLQAAAPTCIIVVAPSQVTAGPGLSNSSKGINRAAVKAAAADAGVLYFDPGRAPLNPTMTPYSTTLVNAVSNAATFQVAGLLQAHATYQFDDGTQVECISSTGYPATVVVDNAVTQAAGARLTLVGNSWMTGNGRVGAAGSVAGTADVYMNSDATPHLSPAGVAAFGRLCAGEITRLLESSSLRA